MQDLFIGVDVSKKKFDLSIFRSEDEFFIHMVLDNNQEGFEKLKEYLLQNFKNDSINIAMESTGSYSLPLAEFSDKNGYRTYLINPARIQGFARGMLAHAKTDKLDSKIIAHFLMYNRKRLIPFQSLTENEKLLKSYTDRRADLMYMKQMEKNRLEAARHKPDAIKKSIQDLIAYFELKVKNIEKEISLIIKKDKTMKERQRKLNEIKGVGDITICTVLSMVPELGKIKHKQLVALVGLAPYAVQSGNMKKSGHIRQGRQKVKSVLYMAATVAIRHNEKLEEFYKRLRKNGKTYKVAIVAVMRKLLIVMNAVIRDYYREENMKLERKK